MTETLNDAAIDPQQTIPELQRKLAERTVERDELLQQQTATAEVLKVISRSAFDLEPALLTVCKSAARLCHADQAAIYRREGDHYRFAASFGFPQEYADAWRAAGPVPVDPKSPLVGYRAVAERRPVQVLDVTADPAYFSAMRGQSDARTALGVPLLREGEPIGNFVIARRRVESFTDRQIELIQTFADQAVIAIENARLFNETKEALERQTATSDILNVIASSPTDTQPVFDAIARSAAKLCEGTNSGVFRLRDGLVHLAGHHNLSPEQLAFAPKAFPAPPHRGYMAGRAIVDRAVAHVADIAADPEYSAESMVKAGFRSAVSVPMFCNGEPIGAINVTREEARPFSVRQIELLKTFADQAVIAIENARLFEAEQQRTRELSESLEQQTATAKVLQVISRSTFDLQAVLNTLTESAARLCAADRGAVMQRDGEVYRIGSSYGYSREAAQFFAEHPIRPSQGNITGRAASEGRAIHIVDVLADPEYDNTGYQGAGGFRAVLGVPLLRQGTTIGVFVLVRTEANPFTEKQIELVTTFADQAVIAIENARLLSELRQSLEQQTATADILKVIASSPSDVQPVFDAIAERSKRLVDALSTAVFRLVDGAMHLMAFTPTSPEADAALKANFPAPLSGFIGGEALHKGEIFRVVDTERDMPRVRDIGRLRGYRSMLFVPLLRDRNLIGLISVTRVEPGPFAEHHVQLLQTFADQAVIAIENVRLFDDVQKRTQELTASLEDLRTAQDRLVQTEKLASLGQLTAGIAHEIKNPLNFVNNFSSVSVELIDELREALGTAQLDGKLRAEIDEIADMLRGNLDKVVQHGKRANSIVKNMLLHSRQGSGEHRPVDINALVEESLNLAYHGARAEKQSFNITLERSLDPAAGEVDLFPQEITRVLLNLISNGFYAATKRKADANGGDYEPTLAAATKNLGDSVEIRIRDNGTGIPPEVKEKMFNPFFTTKPAGEGTGLGLSLSHDIIVKQHAGSIEVDTRPGEFTEFRIVLPRGAATIAKTGEKT